MIKPEELRAGMKVWFVPPFSHTEALQPPFITVVGEVPHWKMFPYLVPVSTGGKADNRDLYLLESEAVQEHVCKIISMINVKQREIVELQHEMSSYVTKIRDLALREVTP